MKYKELFTIENGLIKTLVNTGDTTAIEIFEGFVNPDLYLLSKIGNKTFTDFYTDIIESENNIDFARLLIANMLFSTNKRNWKRIFEVMSEDYQVFLVADEQYNESITENRETTNVNTGNTQNKQNAFDSVTATNTDSIDVSSNGSNSDDFTREMNYRKQSTGALFTPQDLLKQEIELRTNNKFLDLVIKDITGALLLGVYE